MTIDISKLMHEKYVQSSIDPSENRATALSHKSEHRFFEMQPAELHAVINHLVAHYLESDVYVTPKLSKDTHDGASVNVVTFSFTQHDYRKVDALVRGLEDIYKPAPLDASTAILTLRMQALTV